jgi:hypothetical protein
MGTALLIANSHFLAGDVADSGQSSMTRLGICRKKARWEAGAWQERVLSIFMSLLGQLACPWLRLHLFLVSREHLANVLDQSSLKYVSHLRFRLCHHKSSARQHLYQHRLMHNHSQL